MHTMEKQQRRVSRAKDTRGIVVLNQVVRVDLTKRVTFGKEKGNCREKNIH